MEKAVPPRSVALLALAALLMVEAPAFAQGYYPGAAPPDGYGFVKPQAFKAGLANDASDAEAAFLRARSPSTAPPSR